MRSISGRWTMGLGKCLVVSPCIRSFMHDGVINVIR